LGLVNRLSDPDSLLEDAKTLAEQLAGGASQVVSATKDLMRRTSQISVAEGIDIERDVVADLFDTADGQEGFAAFTERRPPDFGAAP
jgi:enoyl-CoA hydratase/carnithine racemase